MKKGQEEQREKPATVGSGRGEIVIYQPAEGGGRLEVRLEEGTLWLNLTQTDALFGVNRPSISKHLKNVYASGELDKQATVSKMETVQQEGGRTA